MFTKKFQNNRNESRPLELGVCAMTRGRGIALFANFRGTRFSLFTFRIFLTSRPFVEGFKIFHVDFTHGFSVLVDNLIHVWPWLGGNRT